MSDERIDVLIAAGESSAPELWAILQALSGSRDPRAIKLALRLGEGHWPTLWTDAFRHLATVRAEEVEAFFLRYLVQSEGERPWLEEIASDYLSREAAEDSPPIH